MAIGPIMSRLQLREATCRGANCAWRSILIKHPRGASHISKYSRSGRSEFEIWWKIWQDIHPCLFHANEQLIGLEWHRIISDRDSAERGPTKLDNAQCYPEYEYWYDCWQILGRAVIHAFLRSGPFSNAALVLVIASRIFGLLKPFDVNRQGGNTKADLVSEFGIYWTIDTSIWCQLLSWLFGTLP